MAKTVYEAILATPTRLIPLKGTTEKKTMGALVRLTLANGDLVRANVSPYDLKQDSVYKDGVLWLGNCQVLLKAMPHNAPKPKGKVKK